MSDDEYQPKKREPCRECYDHGDDTKTYRHFYIGNHYSHSLCTKCRNGDGWDFEINLTYMKKACIHFRRLWNEVCAKEQRADRNFPLLYSQIPKLHTKNDFFRPVARFENYFDLGKIREHIKNIWAEKIGVFFDKFPTLLKYDPVETFVQCVDYALTRRPLKSKFVDNFIKREKRSWEKWHNRYYWNSYYNDFDFLTYSNKTLSLLKAKCYKARENSFVSLQALFRGYIVRKKANDRLRVKSAVAIQASWRKKRAMLSLKKHKQYAVKIQALCRGYYVRRPYGIYRSWALWNVHTTVPPQLEAIVHNLVRHGAVQRPKKRRKKVDRNQKTLHQFWAGINIPT
tara:strand:- start:464 stop:1489 length:1026 start_codon:yes stop_codon:yes gene_type:complete